MVTNVGGERPDVPELSSERGDDDDDDDAQSESSHSTSKESEFESACCAPVPTLVGLGW